MAEQTSLAKRFCNNHMVEILLMSLFLVNAVMSGTPQLKLLEVPYSYQKFTQSQGRKKKKKRKITWQQGRKSIFQEKIKKDSYFDYSPQLCLMINRFLNHWMILLSRSLYAQVSFVMYSLLFSVLFWGCTSIQFDKLYLF